MQVKLFGLEIKKIKKTFGIEGENYIGEVYLNGKSLGMWYGATDGGIDDYTFDTNILNDIVEKAVKRNPNYYGTDMEKYYDADSLMADYIDLWLDSKTYIKKCSEGQTLMLIGNLVARFIITTANKEMNSLKIVAEEKLKQLVKENKIPLVDQYKPTINIYRSVEDFNIED